MITPVKLLGKVIIIMALGCAGGYIGLLAGTGPAMVAGFMIGFLLGYLILRNK